MTPAEVKRVDIPTLGERANYLLDLIGKGMATDNEQAEFANIHQEFDRRFDMVFALAQTMEGM